MVHKKDICCPNWESNNIVKNGKSPNGTQRFRCKSCKRVFQLEYRYKANEPGIGEKIDNQILNSSGVRDTARILQISPNTVCSHLKKKAPNVVNPYLIDKIESGQLLELELDIHYDTQWDEFWSYVGNKKNPYWTWYLIDRRSGLIFSWANGRRKDVVLEKLLSQVEHLPIRICHTDNWGAYERQFPALSFHSIGKKISGKLSEKTLISEPI